MNEPGIVFDESRWPVVTLRFHDHAALDEWTRAVERVVEYVHRGKRFALIVDATALTRMPSARHRQIGASLNERLLRETQAPCLVAWANVTSSSLIRGAITAIEWIARPSPWRQDVFASWQEGHDFCVSVLGAG